MRPSLIAVLALSLVGLSGAAMSDGMPAAKKHHAVKVKKTKVIKKHHRHGPECPPEHDESWAIAEQLNHEEWLRHRQDDLHRRGGDGDDFSAYDDRYARDYAARDDDFGGWDGEAEDAAILREAGAEDFQRDHGYDGRARRYVDKRVYKRYSSEGRGYGWDGESRGWASSGHGWGKGHGKAGRRVYKSYGGDYAWGDYDRFGEGHAEKRVYKSYRGEGYGHGYAGRYDDHDRYAGDHSDRGDYRGYAGDEVYAGGHKASRYGYADDRLYDHRDHARGYGHGGGYSSSTYSSHGYGDGYAHGGGRGYGGGYRFHYDAGYAGRDALGYLTWPGKAG